MAAHSVIGGGACEQILAVRYHPSGAPALAAPHGPEVGGDRGRKSRMKEIDDALAPGDGALKRHRAEQVHTQHRGLCETVLDTRGRVERVGIGEEQPFACRPLRQARTRVALAGPACWRLLVAVEDAQARILSSQSIEQLDLCRPSSRRRGPAPPRRHAAAGARRGDTRRRLAPRRERALARSHAADDSGAAPTKRGRRLVPCAKSGGSLRGGRSAARGDSGRRGVAQSGAMPPAAAPDSARSLGKNSLRSAAEARAPPHEIDADFGRQNQQLDDRQQHHPPLGPCHQ